MNIKRRLNIELDFLKIDEINKIVTICQLFGFSEEHTRRVLNGKTGYANRAFIYIIINKHDQKEIAVRFKGVYRYVLLENNKETEKLVMDVFFNQNIKN